MAMPVWYAAVAAGMLLLLWILVTRVGLAPHDVLLVFAVGAYATAERWRDGGRATRGLDEGSSLLGEDSTDNVPLNWWDFACEHHQLLGCVVRGKRHNRRGRSERFLSLAVSTLAMLYWKAIFRSPRVSVSSLQGLASSLWTLLISKGVQQLMKFAIRFFSGKLHHHHANVGWLDALQLQWQISQYWTLGFMMLCVMLALLEGRSWFSLLCGWCARGGRSILPHARTKNLHGGPLFTSAASHVLAQRRLTNMGFALIFLDGAFTYIKFKLLVAVLSKRRRYREMQRSRGR